MTSIQSEASASVPAPSAPVNPPKVLFLDFDGVILTYRTLMASPHFGHSAAAPDPMLCALLRRIGEQGVAIVVSSSWRDAEEMCQDKLREGGLLPFVHDDWKTCDIGGENSRSLEIDVWLKAHPEVTDYRIADDDDFRWTPEQRSRWYECSPYDGMRAMDMKDMAEWAGVIRTKKEPAKEAQ